MGSKRELIVAVDGHEARATLTADLSPKAADAFWSLLPLDVTLTPGKWSGHAGFFYLDGPPLAGVEELEYPVCSIYPGYFVMRPGGTEILVSYGPSEYRWASGTDYVTPVARITEGFDGFVAALRTMHQAGAKKLSLRPVGS